MRPTESIYDQICKALLAPFLPFVARQTLHSLLKAHNLHPVLSPPLTHPPIKSETHLTFNFSDTPMTSPFLIPLVQNPSLELVPHVSEFHHNFSQSALLLSMAIDLVLLKQHILLIGNQGVGKNKVTDFLLSNACLNQPREYIQLHRDTTLSSLMTHITMIGGSVKYHDSALLRAVQNGRILVIDEADKAPVHVVSVLKSLAGRGEMTLMDGRRIVTSSEDGTTGRDVVIHPNFRMIVLGEYCKKRIFFPLSSFPI